MPFVILNGLIILALAGFSIYVLSGLLEGSEDSPPPLPPDSGPLLVALGDSFTSGEGVEPYDRATDNGRNKCHRSSRAYVSLVAEALGVRPVNVACSGAVVNDVTDSEADVELAGPGQYPNSPAEVYGALPQEAVLRDLESKHSGEIETLVLSLGGNDAKFGDIVKKCLFTSCLRKAPDWMDEVEALAPKLRTTYRRLSAIAPEARHVVMTYPSTIVPSNCVRALWPGFPGELSIAETTWVAKTFLPRLNFVITWEATQAGWEVVDNTDAFLGFRVCEDGIRSKGRAANVISTHYVKGGDPSDFQRGSFHPTELGHRLLKDQLLATLRQPPQVSEACEPVSTCQPVPSNEVLAPTGSTEPLPENAGCGSGTITHFEVITLREDQDGLDIPSAGSVACVRSLDGDWESVRAGLGGKVRVDSGSVLDGKNTGLQVLTRNNDGSWTSTAVLAPRLAGKSPQYGVPFVDPPQEQASGPSLTELSIEAGLWLAG